MEIQIWGLIGLYGGAFFGLSGWYFGRNKAKKQRALDETHEHIWQKARSYSWYMTIVGIYLLFSLYLFGVTMSVAAALSLIILIQLGSWAISGSILSFLMYTETDLKISYIVTGISIIIGSVIFFTVLAINMNNWLYILHSIPFSLIGFYIMKQSKVQVR